MAKQLLNNITVQEYENLSLRFPDRSFASNHWQIIHKYRTDLTEWLPWVGQIQSEVENEAFIKNAILMNQLNRASVCFIFENEQMIGSIALNKIEPKTNQANLGFWLIPPKRGQGIMTAVATTFIQYIFNTYPIQHISLHVEANNTKSVRIAQKLGFNQQFNNNSSQSAEYQDNSQHIYTLDR